MYRKVVCRWLCLVHPWGHMTHTCHRCSALALRLRNLFMKTPSMAPKQGISWHGLPQGPLDCL